MHVCPAVTVGTQTSTTSFSVTDFSCFPRRMSKLKNSSFRNVTASGVHFCLNNRGVVGKGKRLDRCFFKWHWVQLGKQLEALFEESALQCELKPREEEEEERDEGLVVSYRGSSGPAGRRRSGWSARLRPAWQLPHCER